MFSVRQHLVGDADDTWSGDVKVDFFFHFSDSGLFWSFSVFHMSARDSPSSCAVGSVSLDDEEMGALADEYSNAHCRS